MTAVLLALGSLAVASDLEVVSSVDPVWPDDADPALGRVLCNVEAVVRPDGVVEQVMPGPCDGVEEPALLRSFGQAMVDAYRTWTFSPFEASDDGTELIYGEMGVEFVPEGMPRRSVPPEVPAPDPLQLPEPVVHELGPGQTVWHVRVPGVRKVVVNVLFRGGMVELHGSPTELGRAMGWVLDSAGGEYSAAELSVAKDLSETELWSSIGVHDGSVELVVPKTELTRGLQLMGAVLRDPSFPRKDLKRYLQDRREFYEVTGPASQEEVADSAVAYGWFASDHPYGARPAPSTLSAIRRSSLGETYEVWRSTVPLTVLVVGDVSMAELERPLGDLLSGFGTAGTVPKGLPVTAPQRRVLAVNMPGQEQVAIRLRTPAPSEGHEDRVAMRAGQWVLGGHFLSRLNRVLREERGFTYGSRARYNKGRTWGSFTVSVSVAAENVSETVDVIRNEITALAMEGATPEELQAAQRSLVQEWNTTLQTAETAADRYVEALRAEESMSDVRERQTALGILSSREVADVASEWLVPEEGRVWVFVGDRARMEAELAEAGLRPEWLSPKQTVLGNF
ncbi:MAG: insulinase family protein [Myxococcales bacterium]|nr:insulinase family protein [Myxococcales bacterium]